MKTIILQLKQDTVNYLHAKYGRCLKEGIIHLPMKSVIYCAVTELVAVSPRRSFVRPEGNIAFSMPLLRGGDKKIEKYHIVSKENSRWFEREIEAQMRVELYRLMLDNFRRGVPYIKTLEEFMLKYHLTNTSEDSFLRDFRRWRKRLL